MKASITFKQSYIIDTGRKIFTLILLFLTCTISVSAQTSYNANSIPITGIYCSAFGYSSLQVNSGSNNTATGFYSLDSNTTGSNNTANGVQSLYFNTTGYQNTAIGVNSLYSNTTGYNNTANGYASLISNTTGISNTANGYNSLGSNTTGNYNTANGVQSLLLNTTGGGNTANGVQSLLSNTTGGNNTANGVKALLLNTNGNNNTANGTNSLYSNQTGNYNTALGDSAGYLSTGSKNVFLGNLAGYYESTGSNKLYLANDSNKTILYGDFSTGQVLMGKGTPTGYTFKGTRTLNVLGGIIADSMRVALSSTWADYVFADDYKLKPLEDLAKYIKSNKHLPGVPSSDEVATNGIELGSMDAKLLEKIEELHLYILQQQKQIDELKALVVKTK